MGLGDQITGKAYWDPVATTKERTVYRAGHRIQPGRVEIPEDIRRWATTTGVTDSHVILQPAVHKKRIGANKEWFMERWEEVARRAPHPLVMSMFKGLYLPGVALVHTPTHLHMAALIAQARGIVTTEGYCHHVAGALGKPAVVLYGGRVPRGLMLYEGHEGIYIDAPEAVGWNDLNQACRDAMAAITVDMVLEAMERAFPCA